MDRTSTTGLTAAAERGETDRENGAAHSMRHRLDTLRSLLSHACNTVSRCEEEAEDDDEDEDDEENDGLDEDSGAGEEEAS